MQNLSHKANGKNKCTPRRAINKSAVKLLTAQGEKTKHESTRANHVNILSSYNTK